MTPYEASLIIDQSYLEQKYEIEAYSHAMRVAIINALDSKNYKVFGEVNPKYTKSTKEDNQKELNEVLKAFNTS